MRHNPSEEVRYAAKALRQPMTKAEQIIWARLRVRHSGLKIRRQHPIGPYVVDFFHSPTSLVFEIDGEIHASQAARDRDRTANLESLGYRVLRFTNAAVFRDVDAVVDAIVNACIAANPDSGQLA